ncbi:hypothetical protein ACWEQG_32425 [Microbispora sp. NPDC004025]
MAEAERRLPSLLAEISTTACLADPLMLYSRLNIFDAMRRATIPGAAGFGSDALLEFYGGLVTAMPVEQVLDRLGAGWDPRTLYKLDRLLREYGTAESLVYQGQVLREGAANSIDSVLHLLQFEHRFDRMLGYPAQLRPIFEAITEPLSELARTVLGFALSDALIAADAYQAILVERMDEVMKAFARQQISPPTDEEAFTKYALGLAAGVATFGAAPVEDDLPALLTERTSIPHDQLVALVTALATPLGSQPELRTLNDANTLRRRPIIALPEGRYLWARPGDFIHAALDWAADACQDHPDLLKRFDKRRQDACEELTYQTLAAIFGPEQVHASVTYPAEGQRPDIDVLVATPGATLIVEAKGGRFTDPARRAAPDRVKKKTFEFVDKPLAQNARTIAYLMSGANDLRDKRKRRLTIPNASHRVSMIVTLDRVDPFATHLPDGGKRAAAPEDGTWLVTLADLLIVADILRHPAEFYAYAKTRAAINKAGGPTIFVEADALGAWCEHRIRPTIPPPGELTLVGTTSEVMNEYYTHIAIEQQDDLASRPTSHVPLEVLYALDEVLIKRPDHWHDLTTAALAIAPTGWQPVEKALIAATAIRKTVTATRRTRKRARRLLGGIKLSANLTVYIEDNESHALHGTDPGVLVVVPGPTAV